MHSKWNELNNKKQHDNLKDQSESQTNNTNDLFGIDAVD